LHRSSFLFLKEVCLKIPVRKGTSYAFLAKLYTGSESNTPKVQAINGNKKLREGDFIYIQQRLLTPGIKKVFDESKVSISVSISP